MTNSNLPVFDETDREILKHKQVHFSTSFPAMIEYYQSEGKGAVIATPVSRLQEMYHIESATGHDLATLVLSDQDKQEIKLAMEAYHKIESLGKDETALCQLIFSEEDKPDSLIATLAKQKNIFPILVEMIQSDDFYNPLFPGYGMAPAMAAMVLGTSKEKQVLPMMFEKIGHLDFEMESQFLHAIAMFEDDALLFLFQILKHEGLSQDVKHAILALSYFEPNLTIAKHALSKLQSIPLDQNDLSIILLIELCRELNKEDQTKFLLLKERKLHPEILKEIEQIEKEF